MHEWSLEGDALRRVWRQREGDGKMAVGVRGHIVITGKRKPKKEIDKRTWIEG